MAEISLRSPRDCRYMAAAVITGTDASMALLFGLLCGAYLKRPDALYWDVLARFLQKRIESGVVYDFTEGK